MPGRKYNSDKYRYGFNGKEKDQNGEFGSITNYDYGFRIFNPATGRFLSVDPLMSSYPYYTPYQFAGNKPIAAIDLDGLEEEFKYDVYEKMKGGDYSRPKLFQGTQVEIYKKAVENVVVGLNNPTFDYSDEVNLKAAEEKVIYFLSNQITPTKGALTQELIETEAAIKGQTIGALFSGDSEQENKAVNTIKLSSKFLWNTPIANFADVIIPTSATLKLIKNAPVNIALGLRNYMGGDANTLFRFAKSVGALEVDQWAKLGVNMTKSFQNSFKEVTDLVIQSGGKIKFDITSINLKEARAVKGKGLYDEGVGYTQWELNQILDSPKLLKNTEFFENGAKVSTEEVIKKAGG